MDNRKRSQKQEKSVAKSVGGKTIAGSGCLWNAKGAVRSDNLLVECKTTQKDYYVLNIRVWEKIMVESLKDHMRIPVLIVWMTDESGNPVTKLALVAKCNLDIPDRPKTGHLFAGEKSITLYQRYHAYYYILLGVNSIAVREYSDDDDLNEFLRKLK